MSAHDPSWGLIWLIAFCVGAVFGVLHVGTHLNLVLCHASGFGAAFLCLYLVKLVR